MAKDVIHIDGQDVVVREDTAKAFRGVHWAVWTIAAFVITGGIMFTVFFIAAASDGKIESPSQIQNANSQ